MMRNRSLALTIALATLLAASPALAHDLPPFVRGHRDRPDVRRFVVLHERLHRIVARYGVLERRVGRAWVQVVEADRSVNHAIEAAEAAEADLRARVRTAYQFGPAGAVEALLGAGSFADAATISEYAARTISLRDAVLRDSLVAEAVLIRRRAEALEARTALNPRLERLRRLMAKMQGMLADATGAARRAAIAADVLKAEQAAIAAAAARMGTWAVIGYRQDQDPLLALLGPTGGRTCDTPEGLIRTGQVFEGYASWYGWEFGGQPTATGATFDPRLFTAANRWLPFGTFLRVTFQGRCAVVLMNDRGPYGREERVIDLSEAAAKYLGVGVSWVRAEILVPADT